MTITEFHTPRLIKICLSRIQPHPHGTILRHLLNTVNPFLYSSTSYFQNRLVPNDLIIVRNHGVDEEHEWDIKRALEMHQSRWRSHPIQNSRV
jgi:hypothetical protein